jgi:hypothetical protein
MTDQLRPARVEERPAQVGSPGRQPQALTRRLKPQKVRKKTRRLGCVIAALIAISLAVSLAVPFYFLFPLIRDAMRQSSLRDGGVSASGVIISARETNTSFNERPVIRVKLRVDADGSAPYETEVSQAFPLLDLANLRPGARVALKYDPDDPSILVITGMATNSPSRTQPADVQQPVSAIPDQNDPTPDQRTSLCVRTQHCCLVIFGEARRTSCDAFINPNFPEHGCKSALDGLMQSAKVMGKTCGE